MTEHKKYSINLTEDEEVGEMKEDSDDDDSESKKDIVAGTGSETSDGESETEHESGSASTNNKSGSSISDSSGSSTGTPICEDGEYSGGSSSDDLESSVSSVTLIVIQKSQSDTAICAALDEGEQVMMTKAAIRKCRGLDEDDEEDEEPSGTGPDDESHYKEAPDFNFITTYEEYLDHYVTSKDLYYFESDDVARTITTLGFRVPELLTREQFAEVMKEIQTKRFAKRKDDVHIAYGISPKEITCPLMQALAEREKRNRSGNMACLIYLRTLNIKDQEVSGWIDFKLRLTKDGSLWTDYFTGKKKLIPRPSDLCYYNWTNFQVRYNSSDNYLVTTDIQAGLQFMNKLDRKLITVNPKVRPGDNTDLIQVKSSNYLDSALYDHFLRVKA